MAAIADRRASAADLVAGWKLERDEFALLTPGYNRLHGAYAREYDRASDRLAARLDDIARGVAAAPAIEIVARTQYADDPLLSPAQVHLRWALPTGRPGAVAFAAPAGSDRDALIAGRLEVVWVHTGARWRALLGFDAVVDRAVAARAPCFAQLDRGCVAGRCAVEVYRVYDAALTGSEDVGRACAALRDARRAP